MIDVSNSLATHAHLVFYEVCPTHEQQVAFELYCNNQNMQVGDLNN